MKLSIVSALYLNYPIEEVIKRVANMGYNGIELSAISEYGRAYPKDLNIEKRKEILKLAKSFNINICAYNPELRPTLGLCLAHPNKNIRRDTVKYIKDAIDMAADIEAEVVVVVPGRALYNVSKREAWEWSMEGFKESTEYAENRGVLLGLEHLTNLEGNIVCTLDDLISMIKDISSKNFGAVIDTGHVNITKESLTDYVKLLKDKIFHIHWDNNDGLIDSHAPPYEGTLDFTNFFKELKNINYQRYISVEIGFSYSTDPDTPALKSKEMYKKLISSI